MIDIHHHLLPALDDGSPSLETSVAMAQAAVHDGITRIVCTPHASHRWHFDEQANAARLEQLQAALPPSVAGELSLGLGCDFHLSHENIEDAIEHPTRYTINRGRYLLVELPDFGFSVNMEDVFYNLRLAGMTPILTHPERNPTLMRSPERMIGWMRDGLLIQITANSLSGRFGKASERVAHQLLAQEWVHFIATDAHNTETRPPRMGPAFTLIARKYGEEAARRLCYANPLAAYDNLPLQPQPEARGVFEDDDDKPASWWRRLLRM